MHAHLFVGYHTVSGASRIRNLPRDARLPIVWTDRTIGPRCASVAAASAYTRTVRTWIRYIRQATVHAYLLHRRPMPRVVDPKEAANVPTKQAQMSRSTLAQRISSTGNKIEDLDATELFRMADKDADGTLTATEFEKIQQAVKERIYAQLAREVELETKNQRLRRRVCWLLTVGALMAAMLVISVASTAILVQRTVDEAMPVSTLLNEGNVSVQASAYVPSIPNNNLVVKADGDGIAGTVDAETSYPLIVAPYLTVNVLEQVQRLTVRRNTIPLNATTGVEIDASDEDVTTLVESVYSVTGVDKIVDTESTDYDETTVVFYTARGDRIFVYTDSATVYVASLDETYTVCLSDVTCSSLSIDDAVDVADLLENVMPADEFESMVAYLQDEDTVYDGNHSYAESNARRKLFGGRSSRGRTTRSSSRRQSWSRYRGTRAPSTRSNCRSSFDTMSKSNSYERSRRLSTQYSTRNYQSRYDTSSRNRNRMIEGSYNSPTRYYKSPPPPPPPRSAPPSSPPPSSRYRSQSTSSRYRSSSSNSRSYFGRRYSGSSRRSSSIG